MNKTKMVITVLWRYLVIGVVAMLFAGILYAWSILKAPIAATFGWGASELALNFTLAMSFFCMGGLLGAKLSKTVGHGIALGIAGGLAALGFILTAFLTGGYSATFLMLFVLTFVALVLNLFIRKP